MFNFLNMVRFFQKWYLLIKFENDKKRIYSDWIFSRILNSWVFINPLVKYQTCDLSWHAFLEYFSKNSDFVKFCENSSAIITWLQKRRPTEKINWTLECNYTILSPREYRITFRALEFFSLVLTVLQTRGLIFHIDVHDILKISKVRL